MSTVNNERTTAATTTIINREYPHTHSLSFFMYVSVFLYSLQSHERMTKSVKEREHETRREREDLYKQTKA